jgi:hypothetical protein
MPLSNNPDNYKSSHIGEQMYTAAEAALANASVSVSEESVTSAILTALFSSVVLAGGTGTGNDTITVPSSHFLSIQNKSTTNDLTVTIGSISVTLAPLSSLNECFSVFTEFSIVAIDSYNYYTK